MTERKQGQDQGHNQGGRTVRLRAALRENLKRRKAQARGRAASAGDAKDASPRNKSEDGSTR